MTYLKYALLCTGTSFSQSILVWGSKMYTPGWTRYHALIHKIKCTQFILQYVSIASGYKFTLRINLSAAESQPTHDFLTTPFFTFRPRNQVHQQQIPLRENLLLFSVRRAKSMYGKQSDRSARTWRLGVSKLNWLYSSYARLRARLYLHPMRKNETNGGTITNTRSSYSCVIACRQRFSSCSGKSVGFNFRVQ